MASVVIRGLAVGVAPKLAVHQRSRVLPARNVLTENVLRVVVKVNAELEPNVMFTHTNANVFPSSSVIQISSAPLLCQHLRYVVRVVV